MEVYKLESLDSDLVRINYFLGHTFLTSKICHLVDCNTILDTKLFVGSMDVSISGCQAVACPWWINSALALCILFVCRNLKAKLMLRVC